MQASGGQIRTVKKYLTALRQTGTSVGISLVLAAAEGIIALVSVSGKWRSYLPDTRVGTFHI